MANDFIKEEKVAFDTVLEGFEDYLSISKHVNVYRPDQVTMERSSDIIWRPVPNIAQSHDGTDATANFDEATELAVPATIGYSKHSTAIMTATELRDALQEGRLGMAAKQKLASDINASTAGFVRGQAMVCLLLGTFYAVALTMAGLNFGLLIGIVLLMVFRVIPLGF